MAVAARLERPVTRPTASIASKLRGGCMRCSWQRFIRRLLAATMIAAPASFSAAWCHAQVAFDSATDPVYADGWEAGDNGGSGFTPWNFDAGYFFNGTLYSYSHPGSHGIDDGLQAGSA